MKRFAFALGAAAAMVAVPAVAVDDAVQDQVAEEAAPTPNDDIKCAVWAAFIIGTNEEEEVKAGYSPTMAYFLGRYEGATGKQFAEEMVRVTRELDEDVTKLVALDDVCPARMADFGDRLSSMGGEMTSEGEASGQ